MKNIKIFNSEKSIDLDRFIDTRGLICANSGGGKSYAARKMIEESYGKVMIIILDTEGEFKTLREKFDFLLIGDKDADVQVSLQSADLLPQKLLELEIPSIIDISDFKMNERINYVKKFLEGLMDISDSSGLWKPCLIFLDEAHNYCGQQDLQDSTHAVKDLMSRGRKRGYCGVLSTQRISKLHKDAAAEANNILIGRTSLDLDMKRAADILGFSSKQDTLSLRDLDDGEFYVFGPAINKVVEKEKIAEVKSRHPKRGEIRNINLNKPTEKIKGIIGKLNELPQDAKKKLVEVADYKKEINTLRAKINTLELQSKQNKPVIDNEKVNEYKKEIIVLRRNYDALYADCLAQSNYMNRELEKLSKLRFNLLEKHSSNKVENKIENKVIINPVRLPIQVKEISDYNNQENTLGKCEKMVYTFLYHNQGRVFKDTQIGAVTGYSVTSGSFNNALSRLRTRNLIKGSKENLEVNELDDSILINANFEKENIKNLLNKCEREVYEFLLNNIGQDFSIEELGMNTPSNYSPNSGSFMNAISRLNTLGLIKRENKRIRLNEDLTEL